MAILKFENNTLQLFNDSDRIILSQGFRPQIDDSDRRNWIDKADAYDTWDNHLLDNYASMVNLDSLIKE